MAIDVLYFYSSQMNITLLNLIDMANCGDIVSSPSLYFSFDEKSVIPTDIRELGLNTDCLGDSVILGGGGLLANNYVSDFISRLNSSGKKVIGWGVGHNRHVRAMGMFVSDEGKQRLINRVKRALIQLGVRPAPDMSLWQPMANELTKQTSMFATIGVRDDLDGLRWVPCVSCMSPLLDKYRQVKPVHNVVVHEHPLFMNIRVDRWPKMSNQYSSLEATLEFLASGRTVLTSSYHGAYWATLLGRKVVCVPWSTKFFGFRHKPEYSYDLSDLSLSIRNACEYPDALRECRDANLSFADEIERVSGARVTPIYTRP